MDLAKTSNKMMKNGKGQPTNEKKMIEKLHTQPKNKHRYIKIDDNNNQRLIHWARTSNN